MKAKAPLVWDRWNLRHIKKHHVTQLEAEEAYQSKTITQPGYAGKTLIFGKTKQNRYLAIVISCKKQSSPYIVSARDMSQKERKYNHVQTETN